MKQSVSKNYIYNIIYQILTLIVPLITTPYVSRIFSVNNIGIYSYTYSIVSFFVILAELGSAVYARREIAYCQDNREKRSIVFWEIFIFRTLTTIFCIVLYLIYAINTDSIKIAVIQMIYIIAVMFDVTWFFQGMEDFKTVVTRNSIIKILTTVFIFVFVNTDNDFLIYILGLALLPLLGNIVTWTSLIKYIKKVSLKKLKPFRHFKGTFGLFIPTIAAQVYLLLDKTMLGFFSEDNVENAYYEQAQKIIRICWTFLTTFAAVMAPRIAFVYKKNDKENMNKYLRYSFGFVWFLSSALCFGIISISNNLVPWFLGDAYDKVVILLAIFSFILFPIGISSLTGTAYLITIKKQRIYTFSILVGAIFNFALNLILIPKCYSIGAAISSVIAEYIIVIIQIVYICHFLKTIKVRDIFSGAWQYLISGIVMYFIVKIISKFLNAKILNTFILIIIGSIAYFLLLYLLRNALLIDVLNKVKNYNKKNRGN